jgi:hypothetical protein
MKTWLKGFRALKIKKTGSTLVLLTLRHNLLLVVRYVSDFPLVQELLVNHSKASCISLPAQDLTKGWDVSLTV